MMSALSSRDRRILKSGGIAILGMLTLSKGVPAAHRWESEQLDVAKRMQSQVRLLEQGTLVARQLRDSVRVRSRRLDSLRSFLIDAPRAADAGPLLSSQLSELADSTGIEILTMNMRADSTAGSPLARVEVRVNGQGDIYGLMHFLRAIEDTVTLLNVRELSVTQSDPGAPDNRSELLRFEVVVEGLTKNQGSRRDGGSP